MPLTHRGNRFIHPAILFFFVLIIYASIFHPDPLDNVMNRVNLAYALVYDHTLAVDRYADNTVDESYYKGHSYYSEAIGSVPIAAGVVAALRPFERGTAPDPYGPWALYIMTLLLAGIPAALLVVFVFQCAGAFVENEKARLAAALAFGLGTIAFPYATLYYNALAATLLHAAAFLLIERGIPWGHDRNFLSGHDPELNNEFGSCPGNFASCPDKKFRIVSPRNSAARLFGIGFLLCYGVITQFDTVIIAVALFIYLIAGMRRKLKILIAAAGALLPAAFMLAYNAACFGSPFSFGLFHLASAKEWAHLIGAGVIGMTWPHPDRLLLLLFEPTRGLLWCSPFLVFAVPGIARMFRNSELRARAALFGGIAIAYLLLNSSFPYFRGGASPGPRHLLPCLVFLSFPVAYWLSSAARPWRSVCVWLMVASGAAMLALTVACPHVPSEIKSPLWSVAVPLLRHGTATTKPLVLGVETIEFLLLLFLSWTAWYQRRGSSSEEPYEEHKRFPPLLYGMTTAVAFIAISAAVADTRAAVAHEFRARIMMSFGNAAAAAAEYEGLLRARPAPGKSSSYDARIALGGYYEKKNNTGAALRHFRAAHKIFPNRIEPLIHAGNIHLARYNASRDPETLAQATRIFEKIIRIKPDHAPSMQTLAFIYMNQNKYAGAARLARRILERDKDNRLAKRILKESERLANREKTDKNP